MTDTTCQICQHPLQHDETNVCLTCINNTRRTISDILTHWQQLPDAISVLAGISYHHTPATTDDTPTLGGNALVMLAGGTANTVTSAHDGNRDHAQDNHPTDPPSVAATLASIEDDWRQHLGLPAADYWLSTTQSANWLHRNAHLAARTHPHYADTHRTLTELSQRCEIVTGNHTTPESVVPKGCLTCGGNLIRRFTTDGMDDRVRCHACHREYDDHSYRRALLHKAQQAPTTNPDAAVTEPEARRIFPHMPHGNLRTWITRGRIKPTGRNYQGKPTYRLDHIKALLKDSPA